MLATERNYQKTSFLLKLLQSVCQCSDLDRILACALDVLVDELGVMNSAIEIRDLETDQFVIRASRNLTDTQLRAIDSFRKKPGGDFSRQAVDSGQLVFVPNLAKNELFQDTISVLRGGSFVLVPLWSQREIVGTMGLVTPTNQRFSENDLQVLISIGIVIGMAVKSVQQYQHARYLAMVDERDRLSRELHDTIAQSLGCIIQQVNITKEFLANDQVDQAKTSLDEVGKISRESYTDVRETIFGLRASPSNELGLITALKEYLYLYKTQYDVQTWLFVDSEQALHLSPETGIQILRIIQEALSNTRKHARATSVSIRFQHVEDKLVITVVDDGCGFDPVKVANRGPLHLGLQIMYERAESIDGKLQIDSSPGNGTKITVLLDSFHVR